MLSSAPVPHVLGFFFRNCRWEDTESVLITCSDVVLLLLQIAAILAACRLLHLIAGRLGQPPVIGEIVAGLLLGPSFFGWIAPNLYARLFPAASLQVLNELSQIGLILFMFLVGLHLDLTEVYELRRVAGLAGLLSIAVPFALGLALAGPLHSLAPATPMLPFTLLIAVSISVTAFPVLARILSDQKISATRLGHVAIACAAFNDVLCWAFLAWIVAISRSAQGSALGSFAILVVYIAGMFVVIRPGLRWFMSRMNGRLPVSAELSTMLIFVFLSSWVTELTGFHALFGAFLGGVVWPRRDSNREDVAGKIEPLATAMLIPLFFSYTGLRTNIGSLGENLGLTVLVMAAAIVGKVGGGFTGAKIAGFGVRNSLALGCLLNTRGLVELIVLNVGLDLGILSPPLFSMLVMMALMTTAITTPALKMVLPELSLKMTKGKNAIRVLNNPDNARSGQRAGRGGAL
jgi:Kef-type K+ transport system membrane component KefB